MFVSYRFICFILISFVLYYLLPKKVQWIFLLIISYGFYAAAGKYYLYFLLITTLTIYFAGLRVNYLYEQQKAKIIDSKTAKKKANLVVGLAITLNILILAALKGSAAVITNPKFEIIVPVGISFYMFQSIGYLLDVYWKKIKCQKNIFRFALFVSFFPQLSQGPISRYGDLSKTLYEEHKLEGKNIEYGVCRILWGYLKKLVIADRIGVAVATLTSDIHTYTGVFVVVLMFFYATQLYCDFTGGIDITIGIAQVFGIHIEENFIRPFFSKGIKEYWRRWHISMGSWFRDYLFFPLGRSGFIRKLTMFNKKHLGVNAAKRISVYLITISLWFATGIWHGVGWNFIAWGVMNGIVIIITQELEPLYEKFNNKHKKMTGSFLYKCFRVIRTFLLMSSLRLFDNSTVKGAFYSFFSIFTDFGASRLSKAAFTGLGLTVMDYVIVLCGVVLLFTVSMLGRKKSVRESLASHSFFVRYAVYVVMFFAIVLLGAYGTGYDHASFIYNKF